MRYTGNCRRWLALKFLREPELTVKVISANIGERLVETLLDTGVPCSPEFAGDLQRREKITLSLSSSSIGE